MRGSWRPKRTATYWPPLLWPSEFHSRSPGLLNWGSGAQPLWVLVFLYRILSPTGLVSKLTDFLCSSSHIIIQRPPSFCGRRNFALIQPVHGQGYNILIIPRPDAPVIYTGAFPILTARPGRRSIYKIMPITFSPKKVGEVSWIWHYTVSSSEAPVLEFWESVPQWSGRPGFNPRSRHIKDFKNSTWYLLA